MVRDFYLLPTSDGALTDGVENLFSEIESEGPGIEAFACGSSSLGPAFLTRGSCNWAPVVNLISERAWLLPFFSEPGPSHVSVKLYRQR